MNNNNVLIYQDDNGVTKVSVRFSDEDIWITQQQLMDVGTAFGFFYERIK